MKTRLLACAGIATIAFLAEGLWVYAFLPHPADAARNASGTYAKLYTFSPGSVISSSNMNSQFSDMETALTDSLDRNGKGGMSAALRGTDGTVAAPAFSWTSETGSGWYRIGSSDLGLAISGTKKLELTSSLFTVTPNASFTGVLLGSNGAVGAPTYSFTNDATAGLYRAGSADFRFAVSGADVSKWTASRFSVSPNSSGATPNSGSKVVVEDNTTNYLSLLAPNANSSGIIFGDVANASRGQIQYYNSTHGSADQMQFGTGGTIRMTLSNNGIQGNGGSTITAWSRGGCTLNGASPAVCTATVTSGQTCTASFAGTTAPPASGLRTNNAAGTLSVYGANGSVEGVNYTCF